MEFIHYLIKFIMINCRALKYIFGPLIFLNKSCNWLQHQELQWTHNAQLLIYPLTTQYLPCSDTLDCQSGRPPSWPPGRDRPCGGTGHSTACNLQPRDAGSGAARSSQRHSQNPEADSSSSPTVTGQLATVVGQEKKQNIDD